MNNVNEIPKKKIAEREVVRLDNTYIVCNKKRNNPRVDVRICERKCKKKCDEYKEYVNERDKS